MYLFFRGVLLAYFSVFVIVALLWRTRRIYKKTGVNALAQSNEIFILRFLAIVFKIHLMLVAGLVVDYGLGFDFLTSYRFTFLPANITASVGSFILLVCIIVIITAQNDMKTSWRIEIDTENPVDLIETGLFRYSRNPIFLALRLSYFAMFLIVPCPYSLMVFLIGDFAFRAQVRQEEIHLEKTYGALYTDYCSRVKRWF